MGQRVRGTFAGQYNEFRFGLVGLQMFVRHLDGDCKW